MEKNVCVNTRYPYATPFLFGSLVLFHVTSDSPYKEEIGGPRGPNPILRMLADQPATSEQLDATLRSGWDGESAVAR